MPTHFPPVLVDNEELHSAYSEMGLTVQQVRDCADAINSMRNGEVSQEFIDSPNGIPFYFAHTEEPKEGASPIAFDSHFNPRLKLDSEYYQKYS